MYDLSNILTAFLPQLLLYGNPADPLNPEAAALQLRDPEAYRARVKGELEQLRMQAMLAAVVLACLSLPTAALSRL